MKKFLKRIKPYVISDDNDDDIVFPIVGYIIVLLISAIIISAIVLIPFKHFIQ